MIKDLIRVGPPQGSMNDLDLAVPKELHNEMKNDFEAKLSKVKPEKPDKPEKLDKQIKDPDQVSKLSSGGTKKKMAKTKDDESDVEKPEEDEVVVTAAIAQPISNIMVSYEGEVEIADDDKNLQQIETDTKANIPNLQTPVLTAPLPVSGEALPEGALQEVTLQQAELPMQMQGQEQQQVVQPEHQYLTDTEKAVLAEVNIDSPKLQTDLQTVVKSLPQEKPAQGNATAASPLESKVYDILSKESAQAQPMGKLMKQDAEPVLQVPKVETAELNQTNAALVKANTETDRQQTDRQQTEQQQSGSQGESQNNGSSNEGQQQTSLSKFDGSNDLAAQVSALHAGQRSFQTHLGAAATGLNTTAAPKSESMSDEMKDSNVSEIMNQAKYLVTKGGGEMTVRMSPEGMGEVQLKVMLDNGKINIEMNAQDKSLKKMIEDSLSDLKSSLASHQMRVEHVKINNVTAVDTNNQSQFQSDLNHSNSNHQSRQQQEMNFQNMTNSNSGKQQQRSYQNGTSQEMTAPVVKSAVKANNAYTAINKGSSINMVA